MPLSTTETEIAEHPEIPYEEWIIAVKFFRELGVWSDHLGPPPGQSGCCVPVDLLDVLRLRQGRSEIGITTGYRRSAAPTLANLVGRPSSFLPVRPAPVALTPIALLWRPQYPNERPCRSAAVVSAVGQGTKSLRDSPLRGAHEPR